MHRNYSGYCNEEIHKLIDAQSTELDPKKRLAVIAAIQKKLEDEAARPVLSWRLDYFTVWPHVKNMVPHQRMGRGQGWSLLEPRGWRPF
jgi:peptide/nickel transport system substrate-binding protein